VNLLDILNAFSRRCFFQAFSPLPCCSALCSLQASNLAEVLLQFPVCAVSPYPILRVEVLILTSWFRLNAPPPNWLSPNAHCLIFHNVCVPTRPYSMPLRFVSSAHAISRNKLVCPRSRIKKICLGYLPRPLRGLLPRISHVARRTSHIALCT
jgi:hypothetical protein